MLIILPHGSKKMPKRRALERSEMLVTFTVRLLSNSEGALSVAAHGVIGPWFYERTMRKGLKKEARRAVSVHNLSEAHRPWAKPEIGDVDNNVIVDATKHYLQVGQFIDIKITEATDFDLYGSPAE